MLDDLETHVARGRPLRLLFSKFLAWFWCKKGLLSNTLLGIHSVDLVQVLPNSLKVTLHASCCVYPFTRNLLFRFPVSEMPYSRTTEIRLALLFYFSSHVKLSANSTNNGYINNTDIARYLEFYPRVLQARFPNRTPSERSFKIQKKTLRIVEKVV